MSKSECDELIVSCKKSLSPNGKLLMRRLNGQFCIDDLRAFGFERVGGDMIHDKSGIYSETCVFEHSLLSSNNELKEFEKTMSATYPLKDKRFKIEHGSTYLDFFNRIGETIYKVSKDENGIIESSCALVLRVTNKIYSPLGYSKAWYIADLKVSPNVRGQRKPFELLSDISTACLKRCPKFYGIEMCQADIEDESDHSRSRIHKLLTITLGSNVEITILHIFQLTYEQIVEFELDYVCYISLENIKDLVLVPDNVRLPVLHASNNKKSGDKCFSYPQVEHIHMLCDVSGSKISKLLISKNIVPSKAWIVHSNNMKSEPWNFLNTSEI
jgi:hypothetical protein